MDIVRCCSKVKLPGGERKWRRMARLAKFDGTVKVRDFQKQDRNPKRGSIYLGSYGSGTIVIRIRHGHGISANPTTYDPLSAFGHELGHAILERRGRPNTSPSPMTFTNATDYGQNPVERACDRYSRILRARS